MREARRLALIRKQAMIAGAARIAVLQRLAESYAEEREAQALASRARALGAAAQPRPGSATTVALAARLAHGAGLQRLAEAAGQSAGAATLAALRHADALRQAEARKQRLAELEAKARAALSRREGEAATAAQLQLARPVHRLESRSAHRSMQGDQRSAAASPERMRP
jgi:hypothetical protein